MSTTLWYSLSFQQSSNNVKLEGILDEALLEVEQAIAAEKEAKLRAESKARKKPISPFLIPCLWSIGSMEMEVP